MSFVCLVEIHLHFPENGSLKGKRKELVSLKSQLQRRFGASVSETAHHDRWQRATLTAALVGGITESDVMLAAASDAVVIGFNVRPVGDARAVAVREGVEIRTYSVIYNIVEELRSAMEGMLVPEEVETTVGTAEVRATFKASRVGTIAGCYVQDGTIRRGGAARLVRDGTIVYTGRIASLRRFQDDVREVQSGFECGVVLENFADIKEGDVIEVFETRQVERELE